MQPVTQPVDPNRAGYPAPQPAQPAYPPNPAPQPVQPAYPPNPAPQLVQSTSVSLTDRTAQVIYVLFGLLEGLIGIRILLKLFAANPNAGFSAFIYSLTGPFLAPFQSVFATPSTHNSVFEFSSLLGLAIYALIGWGIVRLIQAFGQRQTTV